jgi:hypothetical protein
MSFAGYDDSSAWGPAPDADGGDIVKDALRKEAVMKSVGLVACLLPARR